MGSWLSFGYIVTQAPFMVLCIHTQVFRILSLHEEILASTVNILKLDGELNCSASGYSTCAQEGSGHKTDRSILV